MISQILQNIRSTDKAKVAKCGGVAIVISLGLQAAVLAGVAIPVWGQLAGVAAGLVAHALLPAKVQEVVDADINEVIDVATEIPTTTANYTATLPKDGGFGCAPLAQGQPNSNINYQPVAADEPKV